MSASCGVFLDVCVSLFEVLCGRACERLLVMFSLVADRVVLAFLSALVLKLVD